MDDTASFGYWIRRRRKALDLTQEQLARQVGCSLGAIRKLEADERRPSPEMAARLAAILAVADEERVAFLKVARAERATDKLVSPTTTVDMSSRFSRGGYGTFPLAATPLIGRGAEMATVRAALEQPGVRLLTLTGPGGTGKTRLALAVASAIEDDFADGAAFVNLAPIREPDLVLVTIAAALGLTEQREQPLLATLQDALREKQMLLVLDNFEQVVTAAPLLAELLRSAPGVTFLVTSRIVLGLSGEHLIAVPPLRVPDPLQPGSEGTRVPQLLEFAAFQLFVDRAMAASSTFVVTEVQAQAVVDICQRLDGLPLAIELAAARTRVLSPPALLLRLGQRLPVLTGGARDLPARQQTLRATIDWSYALLAHAEQRLFRRLAVFVGGWTLEAAEAVTGLDGTQDLEVLDHLQSLLDNSLILKTEGPDGTTRFGLYETLREYALERLEDSREASALRQQHTSYYLKLAETAAQLTTPEQPTWFDRLEHEHDNLRAALAWSEAQPGQAETMLRLAMALSTFWRWRRHLGEGVDWMHRALRRAERPSTDAERTAAEFMRLRARVLLEAGTLASSWGDSAQALTDNTESLALYEALGDTSGPGLAAALAAVGGETDDAKTAIALIERSVALYRALGDDVQVMYLVCQLGHIARRDGNYAQSEAFFTEALDLSRAIHEEEAISSVLLELGTVALHQQAPGRAISLLEESVRLLRRQQFPSTGKVLAWALVHLAEARRVAGGTLVGAGSASSDEASLRQLWEEGLAWFRASEWRRLVGLALLEIGEMVYEQGDDERAGDLLRESVAAFCDLDDLQDLGRALDAIAALLADSVGPEALQRAVRLWSAATKWHQNKPRLSPVRRSRYEHTVAVVRTQLGEQAYAAAWTEGHAMTLEQAIAYVLEQTA